MSRRRIAVLTLGTVALLAVGASTCRREEPTAAPPSAADTPAPRPPGARAAKVASAAAPATDAGTSAPPDGGTFARVAGGRSESDLRLLADVARQTEGDPPPSVTRLFTLRAEGASRETLAQHIDAQVQGMLVQAACRRWLAREFGDVPVSRIGEGGRAPAVGSPRRRGG